ncbi:MAG: phosphoenolpyruvate synthase [Bacteroidales bacterium]|nr:phosphoenolpyruvate synthase [Bacteroidales bacterium]
MNIRMDDIIQTHTFQYAGTDYASLMHFRIRNILMICSSYDAFTLEEDGQIETEIYREYVELGLRNHPRFIWAKSCAEAKMELEKNGDIDMIVAMYNTSESQVFGFASELKARGMTMPFILLTNYSREVEKRIAACDTSGIDSVFTWHGNADLILAIIKLFEDRINAETDILHVGVQAILLVEDSIRYYSTYLPEIYKLVLKQSYEMLRDSLNDRQVKNRKRSRPKLLLATNYEDALAMYEKYKTNLLGVITDVGFSMKNGLPETSDAGVKLARKIRRDDPLMPILFQSSQDSVAEIAREMNCGFVRKYSKTLMIRLSEYINQELCFGDFVFRDKDGVEYGRFSGMLELEKVLPSIPDDVLFYNAGRNMLSKWLYARGFFPLAHIIRKANASQFLASRLHRQFLVKHIHDYLSFTGRGVIANFNREDYGRHIWFARVGQGSLGGKARGLAFLNNLIHKHDLTRMFPSTKISIPRTIVVATDYFDQFILENGLQYVIDSEISDEEVLSEFVSSSLPAELLNELSAFLATVRAPLAIRSSSKLEDSNFQPFAGVYSTYMIPLTENKDQMLRMLSKAIKSVYASVFFNGSRNYIQSTGNLLGEEKMAVVVQTICGSNHDGYYYPMLSGVARSMNFYPIGSEKAEDGVVNLAFGLGKTVVDGGNNLRFSPAKPKKILQLSDMGLAMRDTQKTMYALDMRPGTFKTSVDDSINLANLPVSEALSHCGYPELVSSTIDRANSRLSTGYTEGGINIISFDAIVKYKVFPLVEIIREMLRLCREELMCEVEMEFAADVIKDAENETYQVKILQVRPMAQFDFSSENDIDVIANGFSKVAVRTDRALGAGVQTGMKYAVYVAPSSFDSSRTVEMAAEIDEINRIMRAEESTYILSGPGRWGSSDPWLGIPVVWNGISEARMIVEFTLPGFQIEPSQGTHFFQNITSLGVSYITIDAVNNPEDMDFEAFESLEELDPGRWKHVRVFRLPEGTVGAVDCKSGHAVIGW